MNDELAAAWTTLRTTPLGSLDNDTDLERVEKAILTVLAALERTLPLLPLADVIEKLEGAPTWKIVFGTHHRGYGQRMFQAGTRMPGSDADAFEDTLSAALRALAQAVESEART